MERKNIVRICPQCRKTVPSDSLFCIYCGRRIDEEPASGKTGADKTKRLSIPIIALLALFVAAIVGAGTFLFLSRSEEPGDMATLPGDEEPVGQVTDLMAPSGGTEMPKPEETEEISEASDSAETGTANQTEEAEQVEEAQEEEKPDRVSVLIRPEAMLPSSTLSGGDYDVGNLTDNNTSTAWVEGAVGNGIGESVTFWFPPGTVITGGEIFTGYQKNTDIFFKNAAPESLSFSSGDEQRIVTMDNAYANTISLPSGFSFTLSSPLELEAGKLTMIIESVRPGTKYEDACISELSFLGY